MPKIVVCELKPNFTFDPKLRGRVSPKDFAQNELRMRSKDKLGLARKISLC
jgi:hypothetical protein